MRVPARVVEQEAGLPRGAAAPSRAPAGRWQAPLLDDRYSRRVAFLKRVLPAVGVTLLLLVAGWPRLAPLLESVRLGFPAIDLREARELRMVNPRYAGLDRYNRPYVVTATIGRQVPDRNDVMALERPKAVMTVHGGASVVLMAATGIYQSQAQLLDLFSDVNLIHENGTRFVTQQAHINLSDNTAEGDNPIEGHGPSGDITGQGFQVLSKGDTIFFSKGPNQAAPRSSLRRCLQRSRARPNESKLRWPSPLSRHRRHLAPLVPWRHQPTARWAQLLTLSLNPKYLPNMPAEPRFATNGP